MRSSFASLKTSLCSLSLVAAFVPGVALAEDEPKATPPKSSDASPAPDDAAKTTGAAKPDDAKPGDATSADGSTSGAKKPFDEGFSPVDDPAQKKKKDDAKATQWFLGARFRDFIVPSFMLHLFIKGGPSVVNVFSAGPELTMRSGNLEADFSFTIPYADFSMDSAIFRSKKDPDEAYERVTSSLKLFTASVDLLGNIPFDKAGKYSMLIGGGVGISGVAGNITRNQVHPKSGKTTANPDKPDEWSDCTRAQKGAQDGPRGPNGQLYCDSSNDHYGSYTENSWANGGSKPFIFPYLALPHIAFRMQPVKLLQVRVDGGFSITGFFVGLGAGLKLPI